MAVYRQIHVSFWQDEFILDLEPDEKYFYLYLMTNSKTTQCGIYELPKKLMVLELGYSIDTVSILLQRFIDSGKILYSDGTREIFLLNWIKHNSMKSPKVMSCVKKELKTVKDKGFLRIFAKQCKQYGYSIDTLSIDYGEEKEKEKEEEEEEEEEEEVVAGVVVNAFDFYQQNFGVLAPFVADDINQWINDLNELLVIEAMKISILNQKPWRYAVGILKDWHKRGLQTLDDVQASEQQHENEKTKKIHQHDQNKLPRAYQSLQDWADEESE